MVQLTVRGVPPELDKRLRAEARRRGLSLNRTVIRLLAEATGQADKPRDLPNLDFEEFFGTWTAEEAAEFDARLREMRQVDEEMWRD